MTAVAWLDRLDPEQAIRVAGPKLGRLVRLRAAGIPVPAGFVVTGEAFRQAMATLGLAGEQADTLARLAAGELDPAGAAATLQPRLADCQLPAPLLSDLNTHYQQLCARRTAPELPVAVRSSATVEDSATASFAGIFVTSLGVHGADQVAAAVRRCWASLFSERALSYAARTSVDLAAASMAVGVLELIEATSAGVAFSMHPVTGDQQVVVIEGAWGLGEAVVSGSVTPDQLEVSKPDGSIRRWEVRDKARMSRPDGATGTVVEVATPDQLRRAPCLTAGQAQQIAGYVAEVERRFGCPVDVEWVVAAGAAEDGEGSVYLTQARPISVVSPAAGRR
ncbi:MAG TPA: PEP/pyruvate-binding domain-containing protein [Natronosporangium sp.]